MQSVELRYGDPPERDKCKDYGTLNVPDTLELSLDAEVQQAEIGIIDLVGSRLPPWARARYVVRHLTAKGLPGRVKVQGLGEVLVGEEGWVVN